MSKRDDAYKLAVEAARAELAELNAKLAAMEPAMRRKAIIESFLANASALHQDTSASPSSTATGNGRSHSVRVGDAAINVGEHVTVTIVPGAGKNIWEGVREVLLDAKHPMTVPWIVNAMRGRGWKFEAKWTNEIVRGAIQRKLDIFEPLGKGFYALKEWPSELKKISSTLAFKARHGIHPGAEVQTAPGEEDLEGTMFEKK